MFPESVFLLLERAQLREEEGEEERAMVDYRQPLLLSPESSEVQLRVGAQLLNDRYVGYTRVLFVHVHSAYLLTL